MSDSPVTVDELKRSRRSKGPAFAENEAAAVASPAKRRNRISLILNEDGSIDLDKTSPKSRDALAAAVKDDTLLGSLGLQRKATELPPELEITADQVKTAMEVYAAAERAVLPRFLLGQSKGKVRITPEIAGQVFRFTDDQKNALAPKGAKWANESLPLWVKEWIAKVGPGAEFFGGIVLITFAQIQAAKALAAVPANVPPNGHAAEKPAEGGA